MLGFPLIASVAFQGSSISALLMGAMRMFTCVPGLYTIGKISGVDMSFPKGHFKYVLPLS